MPNPFSSLTEIAHRVAGRSHVPYSGQPEGVAFLLPEGDVVAGARIENASFPITIPAWQAAWTRSRLASRQEPVAVATSMPTSRSLLAVLEEESGAPWDVQLASVAVCEGAHLPEETHLREPETTRVKTDEDGLRLASEAAGYALAPASDFRVGCVAVASSGVGVWGCNVESTCDWTRGLCAERVALVTARIKGLEDLATLYIASPTLPGTTPCGACRQVIAELAPAARIVVWNGEDAAPLRFEPDQLLPGKFSGEMLR